ncbi:Senescence regulator S40 [Arabidopsis suecica]|uniref:Senescence regulator S40 n=1 Tax=Arabidopsis suecica TaxID=45249 RepID=A0A8T2F529_ARASU|nr:Senescence regulator S40 [Arabidopsis suecica]
MNKNPRLDFSSPSSLATISDSADGELNEDDIFAIDISHAPPQARHSPVSSPAKQQTPARQLQRSKSGLKNVEASGILAALPESSGSSSYLSHVFHHKPAAALSTSVSSTASSSSSSGGGASAGSSSSARAIPTAPKPPQERLPFSASFVGGGKYPQSAPVQVPLVSSAMMNRHKKEFKLTDVVDDDEEEEEGEMLPPHEIVARSLAQSSLLSCSVLEGAGRTLKGRDLRQSRKILALFESMKVLTYGLLSFCSFQIGIHAIYLWTCQESKRL